MLDREGADGPGRRRDRRRRGDRRRSRSRALADAGVTEFVASIFGIARRARRDARAAEVDAVSADEPTTRARRSSCSKRSPSKRSRSRPASRHLEIYTMRGLLTLLWHGPRRRRRRRRDVRRRDGQPARPGRRPLPRPRRRASRRRASAPSASATASRTISSRCVHDVAAAADLAGRAAARRFVVDGPLVRRRGRDPGRRGARRRTAAGVVTLVDAVGRAARTRASSATRRCCCLHGTDDEILPAGDERGRADARRSRRDRAAPRRRAPAHAGRRRGPRAPADEWIPAHFAE